MARAYARLMAVLLVATGLTLFLPSLVFGHADYERSVPNANEVVSAPPTQVDVFFSQEVVRQEGANFVRVFDDAGTQVSDGDGAVNDDDRTLISATVPSTLPEGRYIVRWKTTSDADGDEDESAFCFYVGVEPTAEQSAECAELSGAEEPTAVASPGVTEQATPQASATAEDGEPTPVQIDDEEGDDSSNTGLIVGIIAVAAASIVAVAGGAFYFIRQRQQG